MPELPEVETVRASLAALVKGKTIARVVVTLPRIVRSPDTEEFAQRLQGETIVGVRRRGKYLLIDVADAVIVSHLRMEGRYGLYDKDEPVALHTHVRFAFTDGTELRYQDVRQFGTMDLLPRGAEGTLSGLAALGVEPLEDDFTESYLRAAVRHRKAPIKAVLLDQTVVAGLGNIYVDEILHQCGIHPELPAARLTKQQRQRLVVVTKDVIAQSIALGGSSIKSYVNGHGAPGAFQFALRVYGRAGSPCTTCGTAICKGRVAGRGTHVCLHCQKAPRGAQLRDRKRASDASPTKRRTTS